MNIIKYKWIGAGLASIVIGTYSVSMVTAQDAGIAEPTKVETPDPEVEGGHVHDENCEHDHPAIKKAPNVEQVREFLKNHAAYILPEFNKVIAGGDEEHMTWMMKDIARIMVEHTELAEFDPKVGVLFSEVLKLENDLHHAIEDKLEAGVKPEAVGVAIKEPLKALIAKRLELEKGQIAYKKSLLDKELIELQDASKKVDEITAKELKAIIQELKQAHEEGEKK